MEEDQLKKAQSSLLSELEQVKDFSKFNQIKSNYLGKSGLIAVHFNNAKSSLSADEFKAKAREINLIRADWNNIFSKKQKMIQNLLEEEKLKSEALDVTLPGKVWPIGSMHPVSQIETKLFNIMQPLGFAKEFGPEIEDDFHNFTALNLPEYHPARGMQDTFYLKNSKLLRTQTSSVQIHALANKTLPLRIISAGRVYRRDADQTHSPMFHQMEMLTVDKNCSFSDLKSILIYTFRSLFGNDIKFRFRASYFPFTEPSGELDIEWQGRWLEVAGYGMVHPNVLKMQGIDPNIYNGYAFGVGLDRLAMILFGIEDLRMLFQNDLRFLGQFSGDYS